MVWSNLTLMFWVPLMSWLKICKVMCRNVEIGLLIIENLFFQLIQTHTSHLFGSSNFVSFSGNFHESGCYFVVKNLIFSNNKRCIFDFYVSMCDIWIVKRNDKNYLHSKSDYWLEKDLLITVQKDHDDSINDGQEERHSTHLSINVAFKTLSTWFLQNLKEGSTWKCYLQYNFVKSCNND
jgi:hypothetical protein